MEPFQVIVILFFCIGDSDALNTSDSSCKDWIPYKNEKCIKMFEERGLFNYRNAELFCKKHDESHLLLIDSLEKQNFVQNFLKLNDIGNNIWIGLRLKNSRYKWDIDVELYYTNWNKGYPNNDFGSCVYVNANEPDFGKWFNIPCNKKNLVVCEKNQKLSFIKLPTKVTNLQNAFIESEQTIKKLEATVSQLQNDLNNLRNNMQKSQDELSRQLEDKISAVVKNIIPVGFIYAQLPREKPPNEIWPSLEWEDISSNYSGVFFRVVGGNSEKFGLLQSDNSPRLIRVVRYSSGRSYSYINVEANGYESQIIDADGVSGPFADEGLTFTVSKSEVRPINMAIKIWRKVR